MYLIFILLGLLYLPLGVIFSLTKKYRKCKDGRCDRLQNAVRRTGSAD